MEAGKLLNYLLKFICFLLFCFGGVIMHKGPGSRPLWLVAFFIALSPVAAFLIVNLMKLVYVLIPVLPRTGSVDTWINFLGSVFSGSITMLALYFTFQHERDIDRATHVNQIRPCIIGELTCYDVVKKELLIPDCINNCGFINWKMINVTDNVANRVCICDEYSLVGTSPKEYQRVDDLYAAYGISIYTVLIEDFVMLKPSGEKHYKTNFSVDRNEQGNYTFPSPAFMFRHVIIIEYSDIESQKEYRTKFAFDININVDTENNLHFSSGV